MVDRWRLETHCFHLPFGEVTITLQDVEMLLRLRVDGLAVTSSFPKELVKSGVTHVMISLVLGLTKGLEFLVNLVLKLLEMLRYEELTGYFVLPLIWLIDTDLQAPTSCAVVLAADDYDELILLLNCHQIDCAAMGDTDRSWMYGKRNTFEYRQGVENFLKYAEENKSKNGEEFLVCPCCDCKNLRKFRSSEQVKSHLICRGFKKGYDRWIWHGESVLPSTSTSDNRIDNDEENDDNEKNVDTDTNGESDRIDELIRAIQGNFSEVPHVLESLLVDLEKPLFSGCSRFTKLYAVLKLYKLKAENGWSNKSFTQLLELLKDMLPNDNELPISTYEAKKILCPLGMEIKEIHACPNDCVLYWKEYSDLHVCPKCGVSRYKIKGVDDGCEGKKGPPVKVLWYLPIILRIKRLFANPIDAKYLQWHAEGRKNDGKLRHPADSLQWRNIDRAFPKFGNENRNLRLGLCTGGMNSHGNINSRHNTWPVLLVAYNLPPWLCMNRKYIMLSLLISGPKQPGNNIDVYLAPLVEDLKMLWNEGVTVFDAYSQTNFTLRAMIFCTINDFSTYDNLSGYNTKGAKACPICEDETNDLWLSNSKKNVFMNHQIFLPTGHPYRKKIKCFNGKVETRVARFPLSGRAGKTKDDINARKDMVEMGIQDKLAPQESGKRTYLLPACYTMSEIEKTSFCACLNDVKHMLPVAIRDVLPKHVRHAIIKLCFFFNVICSKVVDIEVLDDLQTDVCLRCMYPFERFMKILKGYLKNQFQPEGSIIESYVAEEVIEFCTDYLANVESSGVPKSRHEGKLTGKGTIGLKLVSQRAEIRDKAHLVVLQHESEVHPYFGEHLSILRHENPSKSEKWVTNEHNRTFIRWLKDRVMQELSKVPNNISETVKWLAYGPGILVFCYEAYEINGYTFYTKRKDDKSSVQNSGVTVEALSRDYSSARDAEPVDVAMPYYGVIEEIWALDFATFRIPLFRCSWVDNIRGVRIDDLGFTLVDFDQLGYQDEPFILASQAKQEKEILLTLEMLWMKKNIITLMKHFHFLLAFKL
ncbi:uncharacterized protein LOC116029686 [Ipomoea triloba]|uniref:uncharacterized protein LOC116029686 n=1 Tax=Ipomoea triloba TaxID=35885 RepID=UPI00125E803F|nr:uncharacterized protein LOC116029686 [Ipomoea triloba]